MVEITAAAVKAFRDKTGLPMMECKKALQEADGDEAKAIELLRKAGKKTMEKRSDRETEAGRIAVFTDPATGMAAMVELLCESAPVSNTDEFIALIQGMAQQLASGPGAETADTLLDQPFPGRSTTLRQEYDDLVNKIREVFKLNRMLRLPGPCGTYVHHNAAVGVVLQVEGANTELARDICMHIAAMKPVALKAEELDQDILEKEKKLITEEMTAAHQGKPQNILEKMIDGRMKTFVAERCLLDQPFVKDSSKTVAQVAKEGGIELKKFVHWLLGGK